jgi:hypothetical protein
VIEDIPTLADFQNKKTNQSQANNAPQSSIS